MTESKSPQKEELKKPDWVKLKPSEIKEKIISLFHEGNSPEKIGLILRDEYGIPKTKAILNKKISIILKEEGINTNPELDSINKKITKIRSHLEKNKHDYTASKSLTKKLWAVQRASR